MTAMVSGSKLQDLEQAISLAAPGETAAARTALLAMLREIVDDADHKLSVAELLQNIPINHRKHVACIVLRCLNIEGLIPEPTQGNEIARTVTQLCEQSIPEIVNFLRIDIRDQTFRKFESLTIAHQKICESIAGLKAAFSDVDNALAARKSLLGALNHSVVRTYCAAFGIEPVKLVVSDVLTKLAAVSLLRPSLLNDIEECRTAIQDGRTVAKEVDTFLSRQYLEPFLNHVEQNVDSFLSASRAKFDTEIVPKFKESLQRRYPLHDIDRVVAVSIAFTNRGPGLAKDVNVTSSAIDTSSVAIANPNIALGNVRPGDFSVVLDISVLQPTAKVPLMIHIEWSELGGTARKSEVFEVTALGQDSTIDWAKHEYWNPYSLDPAQGVDFIGRSEKVRTLASKLLRTPMENFYITGQKRVGKTSLAIAAIDYAEQHNQNGKLFSRFILWGSVAHESARDSLRNLGTEIDSLIASASADLPLTPPEQFVGTLAPLIKKAELANRICPECRFVIAIDEFDEIHQELYLHGNLAETFFANLRALSRCSNVCVVFIGGENMPFIMERQGQKLNNFSRVNLSYYNRQTEWTDFQLLVQAPTEGVVLWYDDAITEVFNLSNGNPYFAKLMCASILRISIEGKDSDVSSDEVQSASDIAVSSLGSNSFAHLWQDGVPKPPTEREPEILIRVRVLVAIARCLRRGRVTNLANIFASRGSISVGESEIAAVLNDFVRREILTELSDGYEFKLPIFANWLTDVGLPQLVADSLSEELAQAVLTEEKSATVRSVEIVELVKSWPTYRGKHITPDDVRAWLRQRESSREQRRLFEILKRVVFYSEPRIREHLENSFRFVRDLLPTFVFRRPGERRHDIVITYVDGEGKSGSTYSTLFAEENKISVRNIFPPSDFQRRMSNLVATGTAPGAIVIIDDITATGSSLSKGIAQFVESNRDYLVQAKIPIRVIAVLATEQAQRRILASLADYELDIEFRACELIDETAVAFPDSGGSWPSPDECAQAKALCADIGAHIYKNSPLGFGGLGLLVVLPTTVPNNSLPLLHTQSRSGSSLSWKPLFPRVTH